MRSWMKNSANVAGSATDSTFRKYGSSSARKPGVAQASRHAGAWSSRWPAQAGAARSNSTSPATSRAANPSAYNASPRCGSTAPGCSTQAGTTLAPSTPARPRPSRHAAARVTVGTPPSRAPQARWVICSRLWQV